MRILLLGANGQLGTEIRRVFDLETANRALTALTRQDLNVADPHFAARLDDIDFDVLINTTAFHQVDVVEDNPALATIVNTQAVREMAQVCERRGAQIVHVSTDYVFGDHCRHVPLVETDPTSPMNVYGDSKLAGERAARTVHPEGTTIARVASLFGPAGASGKGGNFVMTMLNKARAGEPMRVVSDQIMSPTYAVDAAAAIKHLVLHRLVGTYHVVNSGHGVSWFGLASAALRHADLEADLKPCLTSDRPPTRAKRPSWTVLSNLKLEHTGFDMPHWQERVARFVWDKMQTD